MVRRINTSCVVAAITSGFIGSVQATPQDETPANTAANGATSELSEVVVTAQLRSQPLQDVPVSVSVVSGETLARVNLTSIEAVSTRLPDVKIVSGPLTDLLNIRGVGSGQNSGFEQSVGTFVDGLYRGRSRSTHAALFDIAQVEILKGPQTTFFGNNAISGAINITTRKPGHELEYNASTLYEAETGEYDVEGGVGGPLTQTLGVRLAGRVSGMDGYIDNRTTGNEAPHNRDYQGRISTSWQPSDAFHSEFRFDFSHSQGRDAISMTVLNCPSPFAGPTDFACPLLVAQNGGPLGSDVKYNSYARANHADYSFQEAGLTNTLDLGPVALVGITGYFHHNYDSRVELVPVAAGGVDDYSQAVSPYTEEVTQISQEIRLQSQTDGPFEYMAGAYYSHLKNDIFNGFGAYFLPFGLFNPLGTTDATTPVSGTNGQRYRDDTWSGFASVTFHPLEAMRINLGSRYTVVHKTAHRYDGFGAAPDADFSKFVPFDPITQAVFGQIFATNLNDFAVPYRTDKKFMPSAGVQYDFAPGVMGYVSYSKGFKAGGFSGANDGAVFGPETVNAYEVGLKTSLLERRLTLNTAVFRSDYRGLQETLITFPGGISVSTVANAAQARAQGVELGLSFRATSMFTLNADIAYLDSKYRDYPNGVCTMEQTALVGSSCVQDLTGKRRPYSPEFSGNIGANITLPLAGRSLRVDPLVYFTSKFFTVATADPLLQQSGYAKYDLRVGYGPEDERWEVAVIGRNLADKATASYRNPLTGGNGSTFAYPDPPRTVAVQFSIKN